MKKKSPQSNITFPLYSIKWLGPVPTRRLDGGIGAGGCDGSGGCGGSGSGDCSVDGNGGDVGGDGDGRVLVVA